MSRTIPSFIRSRIALALALAAVPTLQAQQAPAGRTAAADRLEEVLVTARRREESLQDVPASIAVVSGSDLEAVGAQGYEDFVRMVPGLFMGGTSNRSQINFAIRGISTSTVGGANQPTISVYVDEFQIMDPFSAVGVPNIHLTDIDRIEVLRGPQGTLFGSGSLSGALRILPNKPSTESMQASVSASLENITGGETGYGVDGMLNLPVSDRAALRLVAYHRDHPGYVDNPTRKETDIDSGSTDGARLSARFELSDSTTLSSTLIYQLDKFDDGSTTFYDRSAGDVRTSYRLLSEPTRDEFQAGSVTLQHDFAAASLTATVGHLKKDNSVVLDTSRTFAPALGVPGTTARLAQQSDSKGTNAEVRLASLGDSRLSYVVGLYYQKWEHEVTQLINVPAFEALVRAPWSLSVLLDTPSTEKAIYGEATYKLTDTFELAVGLRAFRNNFKVDSTLDGVLNGGRKTSVIRDISESSTTPRVSLSWKPSSTLNIYAQAAKGYRMGQANVAAAGIPPTYDSDFLWNYEVGVKSAPTDGLNLSVALFTINWEDIQIGLRTPQRFNYTGNAGKARSRGAELTLDWQPTPNLQWMTSAAWTDATLREDVANLPQVSGVLGVKKGDRLPGQARFSMSNSMTYNWSIGANRDVFLRLDHQYVGKSYNTFTQAGALVMGGYNAFGAGAGVTLGATEVALRASNLGDTDGRMNSFFSSGQTPTAKYLSPRTISLQVSRRFGD